MPVHGGRCDQAVGDIDAHAVAFDTFDRWAMRAAIIAPGAGGETAGEFVIDLAGDEVEDLHPIDHAIIERGAIGRHDRAIILVRPSGAVLDGMAHTGRMGRAGAGLRCGGRGQKGRGDQAGGTGQKGVSAGKTHINALPRQYSLRSGRVMRPCPWAIRPA